jgi:predicted Holliday junction resolvase-like endonuclease
VTSEILSLLIPALAVLLPIVTTVLATLLREVKLRSEARSAALEATMRAHDDEREVSEAERLEMGVSAMKEKTSANPLLATTTSKMKALVETELNAAKTRTATVLGVQVKISDPEKKP